MKQQPYFARQDLDQEALAKDVVTQKVRVVNPSLSDEQARTVLGTLGLTGAKAVRKVGLLSGMTVHGAVVM